MVLSGLSNAKTCHKGATYMGEDKRIGNNELMARPCLIEISQFNTKPRIDNLRVVDAIYGPLLVHCAYMVKLPGYNPPSALFVSPPTNGAIGTGPSHLRNCSTNGEKSLCGYDSGIDA